MTWRGYVLLIAALAVLAGGGWGVFRALMPPSRIPGTAIDIVRTAERVRVQKMGPLQGTKAPEGAAYFEGCGVVGVGKAIAPDESWVRSFRNLVLTDETYSDEVASCSPNPKVVVRFVRGEDKVDLMLAFDCNTLLVQRNGELVGNAQFDAHRPEFLRLAKMALVGDVEIQSLTE